MSAAFAGCLQLQLRGVFKLHKKGKRKSAAVVVCRGSSKHPVLYTGGREGDDEDASSFTGAPRERGAALPTCASDEILRRERARVRTRVLADRNLGVKATTLYDRRDEERKGI